jgi:3-deoxy-D-manno-octulosonate 8-phosphate phosphatase (KDO 8-P phosphatase)
MKANLNPDEYFKGEFVASPTTIKQKLKQVKAFIFDWDGVFNNGQKNIEGHSGFSEVDSMGINMMRFSHYLLHRKLPISVIITGEKNPLAFSFAKREKFAFVYYKMANKEKALMHICEQYAVSPADVMFVFDDILDFPVAKLAGVRFMAGRSANPLLAVFAKENRLADYITKHDGGNNAIREVSEMVMAFANNFDVAIEQRMKFGEAYVDYLALRNAVATKFYTVNENVIIPDISL